MTDQFATGPFARVSDRLKAVVLMCMAVTLFSGLDTTAKYLITKAGIPTPQVVWLRFVGQMLLMIVILGPNAIPGCSRPRNLVCRSRVPA